MTTEKNTRLNKKGKLRWVFVILLLLGAIVNYLDRANLSIANTVISKEFGLTHIEMGFLLSAFLWPYAIANLPAGSLVDKFGPKKMFAWASGLWSAVTVFCAFANSYSIMYALRMLLGVAESPFFTSGIKVTERWFKKEERGLPTSIFNTGSQIANGIAPPLLTMLMISMGWRGMFIAIGLAGFVVMLFWIKIYRDPSDNMNKKQNTSANAHKKSSKEGWFSLFKHETTWFMIIGNFGIVFTVWVYLTWLPSYLVEERHLSILKTGWIASIPYIAGIFGVLLGGILSDRFIRKGFKAINARKIPIVGGAILAAISVAPVPYIQDITVSVTLLAIGYFAASLPSGVVWTLATDLAPSDQVASLGAIQNFGGFLGAALAPIVTGFIVETTGSYNMVFSVGAGLLLVGALSYGVFLKRPIAKMNE
jgi:sugar phosphate permease